MTQRHKSFKTKRKAQEPVTFDVGGEYLDVDGGGEWVEEFTAIPALPGAQLLDFIKEADSKDGGRAASALVDFMADVIIDDDKQKWDDLVHDPKRIVDFTDLAEICEWLVGQYTERPTVAPKRPAAGRSNGGTGSTESVS